MITRKVKREVKGGIGAARCNIQSVCGFYTMCRCAVLCCVRVVRADTGQDIRILFAVDFAENSDLSFYSHRFARIRGSRNSH